MATTKELPGLPVEERCLVMGVVNVTPDSFSDGGRWFDAGRAIEHGLRMVGEGADIVDVGGESRRVLADRQQVGIDRLVEDAEESIAEVAFERVLL